MPTDDYDLQLAHAATLVKDRRYSDAREVLKHLIEQNQRPDVRRTAAIKIIDQFFLENFRSAAAVLTDHVAIIPDDAEALKYCAFACFALQQYSASVHHARQAARFIPQDWMNLKTLGMAYLVSAQPLEAFLTFSTAMLLQPAAGFSSFQYLALRLLQGQDVAQVSLSNENFRFKLRVDNGQMLEAALHHVRGLFTEQQELEMVRERVRTSRTLVEVGTLVGNHLIYFLKTLKPQKAIVFDISQRSIDACKSNVELNRPYSGNPELDFRPLGIGRSKATAIGPDGQPAAIISLDESGLGDVDFIKIDVDGLEIDALEGAWTIIKKCHPRIMIEIARENELAFQTFLNRVRYRVAAAVDRGLHKNYLIESAE